MIEAPSPHSLLAVRESPDPFRRWGDTVLLVILLSAALLRIPQLDRESLWGDEIVHARAAKMATPSEVIENVQIPHSVGYPLLLHYWMALDDSDFFVRLFSALAGIGSIALVHRWVLRISGPRAALLAALMLCLSSSHLRFSREAAPYMVQTAVLLAAGVLWLRALEGNGWGAWMGLSLLSAASHYLHPLASTTILGWYVLAFLVWPLGFEARDGVLVVPPRSFSLLRASVSLTLFLLLILHQVLENLDKASRYAGSASAPLTLSSYGHEVLNLLGGNWSAWAPWLWLPLVFLGAWSLLRSSHFLFITMLGWCGGTFAIWVAFKTAQSHFFDYHYFISHLPAFAILAALGLHSVLRLAPSEKVRRALMVAAMVGIAAAQFPCVSREFLRNWPDYRGVGRFLQARLDPQDRYTIRKEAYLGFMVDYYCPDSADREVEIDFLHDPEARKSFEESGGHLYAVTRTPPAATAELVSRAFDLVFVVWMDPQAYGDEALERLFDMGDSAKTGRHLATNLMEEARVLAKAKAWEQACERIIRAASEAPNLYAILRLKAEILLDSGRIAEAAAAFEKAHAWVPAGERWWMRAQQAKALTQLRRSEEAIAILRGALEEPEASPMYLHRTIGEILFGLTRPDEAEQEFLKALDSDPKSGHSLIRLGDIAKARGDSGKALEYYRRAVEVGGSDKAWAESRLKAAQGQP